MSCAQAVFGSDTRLGVDRLRVFVVSILAFFACAATAGAQQYSFQYYGVDQGLTDLSVRSLFQDSRGFLWLSTENGVFRYDGTRFQSYGLAAGLPTSNAAVLGEAPDGSLLAGGSFGLYRLVANRFEQIPMPGGTKVSFGAGIRSDGRGRSFIASDGGLMAMSIDGRTKEVKLALVPTPPHLGDSAAYGVFTEKNSVWWGCGFELCVSENGHARAMGQSLGLSPSQWKGIVRAGNEDLWVQSRSGEVAVMRRGRSTFEKPDFPVSRFGPKGLLSVDRRGKLMVPVADGLVIQEDGRWKQLGRRSGLLGPVYAILQDREGSLWLGLSGHGIAKWLGYRDAKRRPRGRRPWVGREGRRPTTRFCCNRAPGSRPKIRAPAGNCGATRAIAIRWPPALSARGASTWLPTGYAPWTSQRMARA